MSRRTSWLKVLICLSSTSTSTCLSHWKNIYCICLFWKKRFLLFYWELPNRQCNECWARPGSATYSLPGEIMLHIKPTNLNFILSFFNLIFPWWPRVPPPSPLLQSLQWMQRFLLLSRFKDQGHHSCVPETQTGIIKVCCSNLAIYICSIKDDILWWGLTILKKMFIKSKFGLFGGDNPANLGSWGWERTLYRWTWLTGTSYCVLLVCLCGMRY